MTTTENEQRDELAQIVYLSTYPDPTSKGIQPLTERAKWEQDSHRGAADAILAAGYRKPRTITTAEELDGLPVGGVIRADNGEVFEKQADGPYHDGPHDWQSFEGTFWNGETFAFPATVLHEPEAKVGA